MNILKLKTSFDRLKKLLLPSLISEAVNLACDHIDKVVKDSKTPYDDKIILPLTKTLRAVFDVDASENSRCEKVEVEESSEKVEVEESPDKRSVVKKK